MPIVHLTQANLHQLTCPAGKERTEYVDQSLSGFYIEVRRTSPGRGTYYLRYSRPNAKGNGHYKIGHTDKLSLAEARSKARGMKTEIAKGFDPKANPIDTSGELTFVQYMEKHYLPHARRYKRSHRFDSSLCSVRLIPRFGQLLLSQITRHLVQQFHSELLDEGLSPAYADHHLKLLRRAFNLAVDWELIDRSPLTKIQLYNEDNRLERLLSDEELQRLITVLNTDDNRMVCKICLFLLSTGARLNEALRATWGQIDQANRVWKIPASNSKSKRIRSVPLNNTALSILNSIPSRHGAQRYLFTSSATGDRYTTIAKVWHRLRAKAGLPNLRIHDLRHGYASMLVNSGRTLYEVQAILGHSSPTVTQRYAHLSSKALQEAAESADLNIGEVKR